MRARPGFALATALACIVIIAVLAAAALFAGSQEAHATRSEILDHQASDYAERSARLAISGWACGACDSLAVGGVIITNPAADPPLQSTVYMTRLDSALFLVVAEGRIVVAGATRVKRRISIAVRTSRDSSGVTRAAPLSMQAWSAVFQM
jgi:hypothetical protein